MKIHSLVGHIAAPIIALSALLAVASPAAAAPENPTPDARSQESQPPESGDSIYDVMGKAVTLPKCNRPTAVMRRGYYDATKDKGFGYDKMVHKHKVTAMHVWANVLLDPECGNDDHRSTSVNYDAIATREKCDFIVFACNVIDNIPLRMGLDYRPDPDDDNNQFGMVTLFCNKSDEHGTPLIECPSWINGAVPKPGFAP
ncbi:hypothetical protein [Rhodococcus jostii]|uniref:hypothetical protein n=1 Tax=Rhodococcus jostii TaxID=132919 RepID=UPI00362B7A0E